MTEQEQIEVWRKEFERLQVGGFTALLENGLYEWSFTQERWEGFLMAKRSQPVVELPEIHEIWFDGEVISNKYDEADVIEALTAAGIQYKVRDV